MATAPAKDPGVEPLDSGLADTGLADTDSPAGGPLQAQSGDALAARHAARAARQASRLAVVLRENLRRRKAQARARAAPPPVADDT